MKLYFEICGLVKYHFIVLVSFIKVFYKENTNFYLLLPGNSSVWKYLLKTSRPLISGLGIGRKLLMLYT